LRYSFFEFDKGIIELKLISIFASSKLWWKYPIINLVESFCDAICFGLEIESIRLFIQLLISILIVKVVCCCEDQIARDQDSTACTREFLAIGEGEGTN
jgi:hypothetical protein